MITSRKESPRVRGTKRKWYSAVAANCSLDMSTSSVDGIMVWLLCGLLWKEMGGDLLCVHDLVFRHGEPYEPDDKDCDRLEGECKRDFLPQSECFRFASHGVAPDANLNLIIYQHILIYVVQLQPMNIRLICCFPGLPLTMCRKENQLAAGTTGTHIKYRRFIECAVQVRSYCNSLQPSSHAMPFWSDC